MSSIEMIPREGEQTLPIEPPKPIEQIREELMGSMGELAESVNHDVQSENYINKECAINSDYYFSSESDREEYKNSLIKKEKYFISRTKGIEEKKVTDEQHNEWLKKRAETKNKKSDLLEMMNTLLLHKGLGKDYIVVRTCEGDDYSGVDNIIVHKPSGTVICAFDDFHSGFGSDSEEKKMNYIKTSSKNGGVDLNHGFTIIEGKLVTKALHNIPIFYIAFNVIEFEKALQCLDTKNIHSLSLKEEVFYNKMIQAFEDQLPIIEQQMLLGKNRQKTRILKENLEKFKKLLPSMKRSTNVKEQEGSYKAAS
jgi:hypothetical protein